MYVQGGLPFSHICYAFKIETLSRSYTHSSVEHKHAYIYMFISELLIKAKCSEIETIQSVI